MSLQHLREQVYQLTPRDRLTLLGIIVESLKTEPLTTAPAPNLPESQPVMLSERLKDRVGKVNFQQPPND